MVRVGYWMAGCRNPKNAPTNVRGTEIPILKGVFGRVRRGDGVNVEMFGHVTAHLSMRDDSWKGGGSVFSPVQMCTLRTLESADNGCLSYCARSARTTYQRARTPTSVPKGTAEEDPSPHRTRFRIKKMENTILKDGGLDGGVMKRHVY